MTTTMTTTTGPTGGRDNANNFAGYVDEDNNDNPIGKRCGAVATKRRHGRRMEKKEEEEDDEEGMASGDDDSVEGKDGKGGTEYDPFFLAFDGMHGGQDDSILSAKSIRIAPETSSF